MEGISYIVFNTLEKQCKSVFSIKKVMDSGGQLLCQLLRLDKMTACCTWMQDELEGTAGGRKIQQLQHTSNKSTTEGSGRYANFPSLASTLSRSFNFSLFLI